MSEADMLSNARVGILMFSLIFLAGAAVVYSVIKNLEESKARHTRALESPTFACSRREIVERVFEAYERKQEVLARLSPGFSAERTTGAP
jgi:hypothetical protein